MDKYIAPLELTRRQHPNKRGPRPVLTDEQVVECRRLRLDEGLTLGELAEHFGVSTPTIGAALYGLGAYSAV